MTASSTQAGSHAFYAALEASVENILAYIRRIKPDLPFIDDPELIFWFPKSREADEFATVEMIQLNKEGANALLEKLSLQARIFVRVYAEEGIDPAYQDRLVKIGNLPHLRQDSVAEITTVIGFEVSKYGALWHYMAQEEQLVKQQLVKYAADIEHPQTFESRVDAGELKSDAATWAAWTRFKARNEDVMTQVALILRHSLLSLSSLDYVLEFLEQSERELAKEPDLDEGVRARAIEMRRHVAEACRSAATSIRSQEGLTALQGATTMLGNFEMLRLIEPPLPADIAFFVDHFMDLVRFTESDIIHPLQMIQKEQKRLEAALKERSEQIAADQPNLPLT